MNGITLRALYEHPTIKAGGGIVKYDAAAMQAVLANGDRVDFKRLLDVQSHVARHNERVRLIDALVYFEKVRQAYVETDSKEIWEQLAHGWPFAKADEHPLFRAWLYGKPLRATGGVVSETSKHGTFDPSKVVYYGTGSNDSADWANAAPPIQPWTSDDALTLILREIEKADDPFKAAGQWLTRFTNEVAKITAASDEH